MNVPQGPCSSSSFDVVWVYYPKGLRSGGPEALHQLVDALRTLGQAAFLVPQPGTEDTMRCAEYEGYDAPERARPRISATDAVVTPEIWLEPVRSPPPSNVFCWWLSFDNCPIVMRQRTYQNDRLLRRRTSVRATINAQRSVVELHRWKSRMRHVRHMAQSHYALAEVRRSFGVEVAMLSDYVVHREPSTDSNRRRKNRLPVVSYNGSKGAELVAEVRRRCVQPVEWLPIRDMPPSEVRTVLERSDIYLDLGHQPGKDRLPREATVAGAVSLIAGLGAGAHQADFPIPEEHRIHAGPQLVDHALERLSSTLRDLDGHRALQASFRSSILGERERFFREVQQIFAAR